MKTVAMYALTLSPFAAVGQKVGTLQTEEHPALTMQTCTKHGCTTEDKSVVIDANWRWTEDGKGTNCYDGNLWNDELCPTTQAGAEACGENCTVEGASYESTYGISASGSALKLGFVTSGANTNVGSRSYLLDESTSKYEMFYLKNREFTLDVDVSTLPCGLNGALYFVEMAEDGGLSEFENNNAGAAYGTGYCDAQCPHDIKYMNGEANVIDWVPTSANSGMGHYGSCCTELDIWEANSISHATTPHVCTVEGQTRCEGTDCGDNASGDRYNGVCDKDGCDFAPFRLGNQTYYGPGDEFVLDSTKPFTLVTQFITTDGTDSGDLAEIRRFYVQDGKTIENPTVTVGDNAYDSITDQFCAEQKSVFGDTDDFSAKGGLKAMGEVLDRGLVLVMSIWDDYDVNMLWLDSTYPTDADPSTPGVYRGTCSTDSGVPADVESENPNAYVTYSDIKVGPIGSTTSA
uniref:cellulose 1,4-beta-cellobiosidase (non-reducing end) n=1 Tax=Florenciella parvula TaxID=236787 RepID=A0A7S2B9T9_9STRA|mmetsp:Transcript_14662/g.30753  ORF Transcript_14662/g.30753 Transcript_14662/m.30753 type:complete len:461 (+) Transcript_14662:42-1424(+)|eukprot:CAMPEP_0182533210 /NCGR_PEP_ID=MMETSP1323-20130603/13331_1 /TAXON_ID=236787 /ORGANISM="Florenciella parvula, Strain RCC1693" /LENGTH=460 /DNA_ID=CAMNT_0024743067 /DNA_START=42 /DNA_END=1424 /DNA_ORIENTATION=+